MLNAKTWKTVALVVTAFFVLLGVLLLWFGQNRTIRMIEGGFSGFYCLHNGDYTLFDSLPCHQQAIFVKINDKYIYSYASENSVPIVGQAVDRNELSVGDSVKARYIFQKWGDEYIRAISCSECSLVKL